MPADPMSLRPPASDDAEAIATLPAPPSACERPSDAPSWRAPTRQKGNPVDTIPSVADLPLLIPLASVPRALAISRADLARLRAAGRFGPAVLRLGRRLLVRRDELERWVQAGIPDRRMWIAIQASGRRRVVG